MSKKLQGPAAKTVKPGETPVVYFSHSFWLMTRQALIVEYCKGRTNRGEQRSRLEAKQPDGYEDHFLTTYCRHDAEKTAMEFYRIGCAAYFKPEHREEFKHMSPEDLQALGDKLEEKAHVETLAKLQPVREKAAA